MKEVMVLWPIDHPKHKLLGTLYAIDSALGILVLEYITVEGPPSERCSYLLVQESCKEQAEYRSTSGLHLELWHDHQNQIGRFSTLDQVYEYLDALFF